MDKIILGLLLNESLTGYKIRSSIQAHFAMMCSDSAGSIQVALKRLQVKGFISCVEFQDGGVNKKVYSITAIGREAFYEWEETPMDAGRQKNTELAKLYFMGNVAAGKRSGLIESYVDKLKADLSGLQQLYRMITAKYAGQTQADGDDVRRYKLLTLEYAMDVFQFELDWYQKLLDRIGKGQV